MRVAEGYRVLVFTRTAGYRHNSIPAGIRAIRELGEGGGFAVDATESPEPFTAGRLAGYRVVVFCNTSGDVLGPDQRTAFESYVRSGGGYVGVHCASATEYGWPFYGGLVGAYFTDHPDEIQPAVVRVEDRGHPATAHLGTAWHHVDEWYNFAKSIRGSARVLLSLDEASYTGGTMGADHPFCWCREVDQGRAFYTAAGHTVESYAEDAFRRHVLGGIRWAAGDSPVTVG